MYAKQSPLSGGGSNRTLKPFSYHTNNSYLLQRERIILARAMAYGMQPLRYEFSDPRHKIIYSNLEYFVNYNPCDLISCTRFISYLEESGILHLCGGASFVQSIFNGIGEVGGDHE